MDLFHFGITFLGIIFLAGGVVTVSVRVVVLGLALITLGMAYFLVHACGGD
ncbi:MAG TPA: hypothetical protein VKV04_10740 [Verrucomicrobiae bacterium]|nr:hypothetical protein [Verrucomicrobiae bacterium]